MEEKMNYSLDTLLYGMQFRRLLEKEMKPIETRYGLYRIDMQILLYLKHSHERNTSKDIMQLNMFTRGHISQSLSRLQKLGYVKMEQDMNDRRCTHNFLTEEADAVITQIEKITRRVWDIVMDGVTEEEREILSRVAKKVNHNIESVL